MKTFKLSPEDTVAYLLDPEVRARIEANALHVSTTDRDFVSVDVSIIASNDHPLYAVRGSNIPRPPEPEPETPPPAEDESDPKPDEPQP